MNPVKHLVDIRPRLDAVALARRFTPPARFDSARFSNYVPDPAFPSQAATRDALGEFARPLLRKHWWKKDPQTKYARYLDGGFGVGKTHLLASLWHQFSGPKTYLTFTELTAYIGFAGMGVATDAFSHYGLVCIDEFELDDVANTLMVVSFLRAVMNGCATKLAVTSNTLPDRLGEQRFSASDFTREITAIADHFEELRIDGADYRTSHSHVHLSTVEGGSRATTDEFDELLAHLRTVHPVHYGALLDHIDKVTITGLHSLDAQDDALLVVQMIDELYDAQIPVHIVGCSPEDVFAPSYRKGGYRKKYGRAESRLIAMQAESADRGS